MHIPFRCLSSPRFNELQRICGMGTDAPEQFRPFAVTCTGAYGGSLGHVRATLRAESCGYWPNASQGIMDSLIKDVLPKAQREYSQLAARRLFEHVLALCNEVEQADLRSHAFTAVSVLLNALPKGQRVMVHESYHAAVRRRVL